MTAIRIAVIGGGLGGCTLANGLLKHPHIEFDVFEGSSAFKEQGLAVGLATNAQSALKKIGSDVHQSLEAAGGVATASTRIIMELLKPVPKHQLHVDKKLERIEQGAELLTLHFADGSTAQYHAVVGSDGIHSTVRKTVLADHPDAIEPFFTGFWDVRTAVPIEVAKDAKIVDPANPSETGWVGDGGFILHQFINNGELVGCIAAAAADESYDGTQWRNPVTKEKLAKALGDRGEFGESMIKILLDQPEPFAFSQYESAKAPTYSKGPVCLMGDAAHAMTPWQGSGAGTSIEDAMTLEFLLGKVTSPSQIPAAFRAYDEIRRPRTQKVVESSREVGAAFCGKDREMGVDVQKLSAGLQRKWDHIWSLDMDQHLADTSAAFERFKDKA
ncbi:hypothetical protein FH972_024607 [Carpinus fangiana]|uniref:FAD-binding domain-containing protein n=1 Tax=Carpinus fangiana TaxID=176857 RepID=A0A5N6KZ67_9ROSI|nr:hypothetical protein FH972_024607 [Carpinus fangiana]